MARKSTKAELVIRRDEVQDLIVKGYTTNEICSIISEKYKIKKRVVSEDIREVGKAWEAKSEESRLLNKNKALTRLEHMFQIALNEKSLKNALEIQKEINKLNALHSEIKAEDKPPQFITLTARDLTVVPKASGDDKPE